MTQEEKQLLLIDLCARLPYKVKGIYARTDIKNLSICEITTHLYGEMEESFNGKEKYEFIPYLRPMSSMTEEEEKEIRMFHHCFYREGNGWITAGVFGTNDCGCTVFEMADMLNYLNANHFDYRGLIEKGLALEAPEGMYK